MPEGEPPLGRDVAAELAAWIDQLAIRDLIERSMRYVDDRAGDRYADCFDEDGVVQLAGRVYAGRASIAGMFPTPAAGPWTEPGGLLRQPGGAHHGSNPVIDVDGDHATAETDMLAVQRDDEGRARIALVARYRDRLRRIEGHRWVITNRTGVSISRPGEAGTDAEWRVALERMPTSMRAAFRFD